VTFPPKVAPWRSQALKLRPGRCIAKYVNHQDGGGFLNRLYVNLYLQPCNYVIQKRTPDVTFRGLSLNCQMSNGTIRKLNKMLFFNNN
jgi:hypothetical protein